MDGERHAVLAPAVYRGTREVNAANWSKTWGVCRCLNSSDLGQVSGRSTSCSPTTETKRAGNGADVTEDHFRRPGSVGKRGDRNSCAPAPQQVRPGSAQSVNACADCRPIIHDALKPTQAPPRAFYRRRQLYPPPSCRAAVASAGPGAAGCMFDMVHQRPLASSRAQRTGSRGSGRRAWCAGGPAELAGRRLPVSWPPQPAR